MNRLKTSGNLPSMPQVLVQLIDACHKTEVDLREVSSIVEQDTTLSAKILQLANSAFMGAKSSFVDVGQAVIYLGADTVKNLAISVSVQQVFRRIETNGLLSMDRFWYHSCLNAVIARQLATITGYPNPSEAYLAGLLHDIGKLVLWMAFPGKYAPLLLKGIRCHNGRLAFLEQEKLQINHCQAGAWLVDEWHFPSLFSDAIRFHHHPVDELVEALALVRLVYLADLLSHAETREPECEAVAQRFFDLEADKLWSCLDHVEEQVKEMAETLGIPIPSSRQSSLAPEPTAEAPHRETSLELISRVRDISQLNGAMGRLIQAEDQAQIIRVIEESLKILFSENRALVLCHDQHTGELYGCASTDNPYYREAGQLRFRVDQHPKSLACRAVELDQITHSFMNRSSQEKNILDEQILHLLGTDGLLVVPMSHRKQVLGVLVIGIFKDSYRALLAHATPLQLLAAQAATSLYIEQLHREEAQRLINERLEAAGLVARKIAHEINNPLAILRNYMKILDLKLGKDHQVREELTIIDSEFERIGKITEQLRDLSTPKSFHNQQSLDLNHTLEDIINLLRMVLDRDRNIRVQFKPADNLPPVIADANALRQVMINLCTNAADAMPDGGTITIATQGVPQDNPERVQITVTDTGTGIDASMREKIFHPGISSKGGGHAGLGLAIVQKIIRDMGGELTFETSTHGTTFSATLPAQHT
ncbi:HDOD domain-containing protein [Desulfolithobacter sp.]